MKYFFKRIVSNLNLHSKRTKITVILAVILVILFFVGRFFYNKYHIDDYSEITILVNNREYRLAEQKLQPLLEDNARDPYFLILVARTYVGLANTVVFGTEKRDYLEKSLQVLNDAELIDPTIVEVYRVKALTYMNLGEFLFAETFYSKALSLNPDSKEVLNDLGNLYVVMSDIDKANTTFSKVLDMDPANEQARVGIVKVLVYQERIDQALGQALSIYNETKSSDLVFQLDELLGNIYKKKAKYDDAKRHYESALKTNPGSVYSNYGVAEISFAKNFDLKNIKGSLEESKELAKRAVSIDPSYPYSYILLTRIAWLERNQADYDKYIKLAKETLGNYIYLKQSQKDSLLKNIPVFALVESDSVKIRVTSVQSTTTRPKGSIIKK